MTIATLSGPVTGLPRRLASAAPDKWISAFGRWRATVASRRRLLACAALDPRFVSDVGLTPAEIDGACRQPFWRPMQRAGS